MQNSQQQAQIQQQAAAATSQAKQQELQVESQLETQMLQVKHQLEMQRMSVEHEMRKEIETIKAQATLGFRTEDQEFREKLEVLKEDRKDDRIDKEAIIRRESESSDGSEADANDITEKIIG